MTDRNIPNDSVSIGEGFAYYRWHLMQWDLGPGRVPASHCPKCRELWDDMQRAHHPALKETP